MRFKTQTLIAFFMAVGLLTLTACGGSASSATAEAEDTPAPRGIDRDQSYFEITGFEEAAANPKVRVVSDPGEGEGIFTDGITRYVISMVPEGATREDLNVWIMNLPADAAPGTIELGDRVDSTTMAVGTGRGLLKGYKKLRSGTLTLEENGESLRLRFEAVIESQSMLDKERAGQTVTVRGWVDAKVPTT